MAQVFVKVESEVNRSLQEVKAAVEATVTATCALSCGTGDSNENDKTYLEAALTILGNVVMSDTEEDGVYEVGVP